MEEKSKRITGEIKIPDNLFSESKKNITSVFSFKETLNNFSSQNISEILELILIGAIIVGSSDVHIESEEDKARIRIRIDGALQDVFFLENKIYQSALSRIKLVSGLKLNITQKPQDGGFSIILPGSLIKETYQESIEIRTSTLPSEHGETIVMRILNPKNLTSIDNLGLRDDDKKLLEQEIKKKNGMIAVTGPTGSGKTTTLYAVLSKIKDSEIKIITIEDPIEYHLSGISQTEIHKDKGYDFANGLRAIVRQDPDVILVGEIRDLETVQIALQSALTGHLVLTTLHTNDATGAISRLQSLGEDLHNIAPAINIIIAQRLARKPCSCAKKEKLTEQEYQKISQTLKNVPKEIIDYSQESEILHPSGCYECDNSGYKGRIGIFELFEIDSEIENFILTSPSSSELRNKAIEKGMITMYQDGIIKVLKNETTLEELQRVISQ